MVRPAPDPAKLLEAWMEWERGETPPGRVISNLKTGGLRVVLEELVSRADPMPEVHAQSGAVSTDSWTPVV